MRIAIINRGPLMTLCLGLSLSSSSPSFAQSSCDRITDNVRKLQCVVRENRQKNPPALVDFEKFSDEQKDSLAGNIRNNDLNCPKVSKVTKVGEDANGWIVRITCVSLDTDSTWELRMIGYPLTSFPRFEPW